MDGAELATADMTEVDLEAYVDSKLKRNTLIHLLKKYEAGTATPLPVLPIGAGTACLRVL